MKTVNYSTVQTGLGCPHKGYQGQTVYAVVRFSHTTRYIFLDGQTLTYGPKTFYATRARPDNPENAVTEAVEEFNERFPLTRNRWVERNGKAFDHLIQGEVLQLTANP